MKIFRDYSIFAERLDIRNPSQVKAPQGNARLSEIADKFIEKQQTAINDRLTISGEGIDYIKEQLTELSKKEISPEDKHYADYIMLHSDTIDEEGVSRSLYLDINSGYLQEMKGRDPQNWEDHMEALSKVYADVRQRITKGYEDGTRNVWVRDDGNGEEFEGAELEEGGQLVRYRKLTREEEISLLDKSIDKFTKKAAEWYAEEAVKKAAEAAKKAEGEKEREENKDLEALRKIVNGLVDEARNLLDKVREEIAKLEKMSRNEIDFESRMEEESYNHRAETEERGRQLIQNENYKKMSRMVSDVMTLKHGI